MNTRLTWLLLLTALGLGAWLYWTDGPGGRTPGNDRIPSLLESLTAAEVTAVELARSNAVIRVERVAGGWRMTAPVAYPAEGSAVEFFLRQLVELRPRDWIPFTEFGTGTSVPEVMQATGLGAGGLTATLESSSGKQTFNFGGLTPVNGQFYLQRAGDDGVFVATAALLKALPATADHWRSRSLFEADAAGFDRIELRGKTTFEARRLADGGWQLTKPLSARADGTRIETLIRALQSVRVAAFVTDAPAVNLEPLGLQPPQGEIVLGRGATDLARLQLGFIPTNAPGYVLVRRPANTNVVLVTNTVAGLLQLPLETFRDRRLVPPLDLVDRIEFGVSNNLAVVARGGTNWAVVLPRRFPADPGLMQQWLNQLAALEIVAFPNDVVSDLARYGLDAPQREFALHHGTNRLVHLQFGKADGLDKVFVRRLDEPAVYSVPLAELVRLPEVPDQLRDLRFEATNVVRVEIRHQGRTRTLERGADGAWQVTAGAPGAPLEEAVNETLFRLGQVRGPRYVVRDEEQLKPLKFAEVAHTLTLHFRAGGPLRQMVLRFGGRNAVNNLFAAARFDDDPTPLLFEFPGTLYEDVARELGAP